MIVNLTYDLCFQKQHKICNLGVIVYYWIAQMYTMKPKQITLSTVITKFAYGKFRYCCRKRSDSVVILKHQQRSWITPKSWRHSNNHWSPVILRCHCSAKAVLLCLLPFSPLVSFTEFKMASACEPSILCWGDGESSWCWRLERKIYKKMMRSE